MADLIVAAAIGVLGGTLCGPPLGYWSVRWQDKLDRHRAQCAACQRRAARRAEREHSRA